MAFLNTIKYIYNHPLNRKGKVSGIIRFVKWQIVSRINRRKPRIHKLTEKSSLLVKRGMTGATGNIYCGLAEFEDMSFVLHFLRTGDLFIDIGANVGVYTVLSSAHIRCKTICFEPVPSTFKTLLENIEHNRSQDITIAYNIALGSARGTTSFTSSLDTLNHIAKGHEENVISVPIDTLDNILGNEEPIMIKIDVEGFETEVMIGAEKILSKKQLKVVIIELNGSGKRYGFDDREIHQSMVRKSFQPYQYDPFKRQLHPAEVSGPFNTIYIRDVDFVTERLRLGNTFTVLGQTL